MSNLITLQELAEKLKGNYWEKGNLRRIYLDKGYNTKKMSTKTFVWQNEKGEFVVSCRVECPSQPFEWCKSQEEQVKASVYDHIENILALEQLELVDFKILEEDDDSGESMVYISENNEEPVWLTEEVFYDRFGCYPEAVFEQVSEALEPLREKARKEMAKKEEARKKEDKAAKEAAKKVQPSETMFGVKTQVKHNRFGTGTVISETEEMIEINFHNKEIGVKSLLKKFCKLDKVSND